MKKLGLFKKIGLTAIVVLLCLAMMITYFSFVMPFGRAPLAEESSGSGSKVDIAEKVSVKNSVDYGEDIDVPDGATVTAPDGTTVTPDSGKVKALQVGNYKLSFGKDDISYDFYVRVALNKEYFLKVDYDGAEIPTYVEVNKSIVLPQARIVFYNDDNILQEYPGEYSVTVTNSRSNANDGIDVKKPKDGDIAAADRTYNVGSTTGKLFFTYTAKLDNGTKHFSQTYTTNVQSNVTRTGNPTLSVSGVQKDVSVNRAVTLPKATASDSYDDNIKIEIKVTYDGKPVKNVELDENGYAVKELDDDVIFDNDKAMTFYPTKTDGSYKVEYTAYNDAWEGTGTVGKSSTREFWMKASDLAAPVFTEVDEFRIPETWGMTVYKADADGKEELTDLGGKIHFTVPTVVDNKDHMFADESVENDNNLISMYFRIYDSDKSKTVIEFTNILAKDDDAASRYTASSTSNYKTDATFSTENGFDFDFSDYRRDSDDPDAALTGTYTVLYRARDKANNTSSKTYTITLNEEYKDTAAPANVAVTVPDYITAVDENLDIPYASYADADTRPHVVYRVYTDATVEAGKDNYIDVKGGEAAELKDGKLVIDENELALGENLYFYVGVTDKAGNFTSNTDGNVDLNDGATADDLAKVNAKVKVIPEDGEFKFNGDSMTFKNIDGNATVTAGDRVVASGFNIETASLDMRNYTGFEVTMYTPDGDVIPVTLETVTVPDTDKATIYVQNIEFHASVDTAKEDGTNDDSKFYYMTVRVFDVNGNNSIYGYKFTGVKKAPNNLVSPAAVTTIGSTGDVNVTYKLHNEDVKVSSAEDVYFVRKITGKSFSLMGNEFTAKTADSYGVRDGYIEQTKVSSGAFDYKEVKPIGSDDGVYNFAVTDETTPVIEIQGVMPTYWEKYDEKAETKNPVQLPNVVAYTDYGFAEIEVEVTDKDGRPVDYDKENRTFKGTLDGAYTVTYTAVAANSKENSASYKINVGDVEGPEFTVSGGTSTTATMKVGDTFKFGNIKLANENETGVQVTKKLIDPSKAEVTDATVNGTYSNNKDKSNDGVTFSMAGTYEVVYEAKDSVGNTTTQRYTITVVSSGSSTPTTWTTLSTVLIIVAVVLLAGVIVYVVRFRKVKK